MLPSERSGGSVGSGVGKAIAKAVKPKSVGRSVGSTAAKTAKKTSSSRGSSVGRSSARSVAPRRSGTSSGSVGRSSSSGGSSRSVPTRPKTAPIATPAPKPKISVPSIDSYLGTDSIYQQAVSGGKRSLADYLSEVGRRRGEAGTQFNQTTASMERDRTQQLEDLRNEFASRGLINSGLYGEQQGNFQEQFTEQQTALQQQQAALMADLLSQETNYKRENDLTLQAAKQEALARRAAKYKIGA